MENVKEGIVLEFPHLEFTSHVQSYLSHTWTDFDIPLGSEQIRHPEAFENLPLGSEQIRHPEAFENLPLGSEQIQHPEASENLWSRRGPRPGVDTTCSLHFGVACTLLSASQRPGQRLFWVNLGQRRLPSAAVSFVRGHIQLLVETRFQSFKKAAQTQQTPKLGRACPTQGADS